jgi:RNA polymerase sigma factor (sigma-70 family)
VFQEVSIRLWKSLPRLRRTDTLAPWLATTTRRLAWRLRSRARSRTEREKETARGETAEDASPSQSVEAVEEEQAVREALASLGERCRRLLRALYFDASLASYDEVAARLGIPRGSIGPTRQRCLSQLREALGRAGFKGPDVPPDVSPASPGDSSTGRIR